MGGGSVLRCVASGGLRRMPPPQTAEHISSDDFHDWDFAFDATPRVVSDADVPTFHEARAAASELKNALLHQVHMSSNSSVCSNSADSEVSVQSPLLPGMQTKSCVIEPASSPSMPKHALQAFKFLSTNSEAQTILASVASDPNVWNAVMQNPSLKGFLQSQQTAGGVLSKESLEMLEKLNQYAQKDNQGNGFEDFMKIMQNFKVTVNEMVSNVSKYFNNMFGLSERTSSGANGNTMAMCQSPLAMGETLMGLAVLVIVVVLLKRV